MSSCDWVRNSQASQKLIKIHKASLWLHVCYHKKIVPLCWLMHLTSQLKATDRGMEGVIFLPA